MGMTTNGKMDDNPIATPASIRVKPRYIGFLLRPNGPVVTKANADGMLWMEDQFLI